MALVWGRTFYLLNSSIAPPKQARIYSPSGFATLAGTGTLADFVAYLFERDAYPRNQVRFAVFVRPADPAIEAKQRFLLERFPDSTAAKGLPAAAMRDAHHVILDLGSDFVALRITQPLIANDWTDEVWLPEPNARA